MPCFKIKQLDERVSCSGLHLGGGPERRKLEPGEIIDIPESVKVGDRLLADIVMETGKVEITLEAPTRPLDYASYAEAVMCAPNFKPHDSAEEKEMRLARAAVQERLLGAKPKKKKVPKSTIDKPEDAAAKEAAKRREKRRQAISGNA